jgi:hypothetical protein
LALFSGFRLPAHPHLLTAAMICRIGAMAGEGREGGREGGRKGGREGGWERCGENERRACKAASDPENPSLSPFPPPPSLLRDVGGHP